MLWGSPWLRPHLPLWWLFENGARTPRLVQKALAASLFVADTAVQCSERLKRYVPQYSDTDYSLNISLTYSKMSAFLSNENHWFQIEKIVGKDNTTKQWKLQGKENVEWTKELAEAM